MRPSFRALLSAPFFPRPASSRLRALLACLTLLLSASAAFAQAPPAYPGTTSALTGYIQDDAGDTFSVNTWNVSGPGVYVTSTDADTKGWGVTGSARSTTLSVTVPANAPLGSYTASYATKARTVRGPDGPDVIISGPTAQFQVVPAPPTLPIAGGGPAFSWQGNVGGVNTGNGNKLTSVPLTGWTQRGGIAVSCALYHNSQGQLYGPYGAKWLPSYFTYISVDGGGNPTLHWDNGLTYSFSKNGTVYTPPYGILDTLASTGSGTWTLTTPGKTVYTFGFAPGGTGYNAYLTRIQGLDGNALTINHNADTTISTVVDATGRALTFGYAGGKIDHVTDPLGRTFGFFFDGAGDLRQVNTPLLNGRYYVLVGLSYDGSHDIASMTNPRGNAATFGYDGASRLWWSKDALGSQTTFSYGTSSTTVTDPNGHTLTHTYQDSRLASVTDAANFTEKYVYDYNNILNSRTDKRGGVWYSGSHFNKANLNLDGTTTSTMQDALGNVSTATYDPSKANKQVKSQDPLGNTTATAYSTDGHYDLLSSTVTGTGSSPFTATSTTGGYSNGLPTTFTDALNFQSSVTYDPNGWGYPAVATDANGNTAKASFNALGWKLDSTDGMGNKTVYAYDGWGRVTGVTAPDGTSTSTVYDLDGNVVRVSDANAAPLTLSGAVSWAAGVSGTGLAFNGTGGAVAANPALGNFGAGDFTVGAWIKLSPGQVGYLFSKRAGCSASNFWEVYVSHTLSCDVCQDTNLSGYWGFSGTHPVDDGAWHYVSFARTGNQFALSVDGTLDASNTAPMAYSFSNAVALRVGDAVCSGPGGNGAPRFSGLLDEVRLYGRALSGAELAGLYQQAALPSLSGGLLTWWNCNEGNGGTAYDACHSTVNTYDADDRLIQTVGGNGDSVIYTYDGPSGYGSADASGQTQRGLLSKKTDGNGHVTTYTYTALNQPLATFYPDGTSESVTYDAGGNVLTRIKPDGKTIRYTYDLDNRLTDITYPTLAPTHFDYDADGRRTHMKDATGDTTWTFSDGLHLNQMQSPQGSVFYGVDKDSRRSGMAIFNADKSGYLTWHYYHDSGGRLTSNDSPAEGTTTYSYDGADRLKRKTKGDGDYEIYSYDVASQMTGIGYYWFDDTGRNFHNYTYDPAGNLLTDDQGFFNTRYLYDGSDQLTGEVGGGTYANPTLGYTYDHNGNRLDQTRNGSQVQAFTYDAHDKLTQGANETTFYDPNGSLRSDSLTGQTFTYDDEDRLTAVSGPGYSDTFTYNGLGLRVGKTDTTGTYSYLCDGASPGAPVLSDGHATYTPGLSENRGGAITYPAFDRIGNLWTQDASPKSQTFYEDFTGFGSLTALGGGNASPFRFGGALGCQTDADTGLVLMGHRYFDPRTGRFITQDPAGDGDNWYAYADNSPVNAVDPSGLAPTPGAWSINGGTMSDAAAVWGMFGASSGHWMFRQTGAWDDAANKTVHIYGVKYWVSDGEPGLFDGTGHAALVGLAAVASVGINYGLYNGGSFRHDPSFGTSASIAGVGITLAAFATGSGELKASETLVTHWGSEAELAEIATNGFKSGTWVMKGKANYLKYFLTGVWNRYPYASRITRPVSSSSITQEGVDFVQKILQHYRIGP